MPNTISDTLGYHNVIVVVIYLILNLLLMSFYIAYRKHPQKHKKIIILHNVIIIYAFFSCVLYVFWNIFLQKNPNIYSVTNQLIPLNNAILIIITIIVILFNYIDIKVLKQNIVYGLITSIFYVIISIIAAVRIWKTFPPSNFAHLYPYYKSYSSKQSSSS